MVTSFSKKFVGNEKYIHILTILQNNFQKKKKVFYSYSYGENINNYLADAKYICCYVWKP